MPTPEKLATDATVAIMLADGFEEVEALAVADVLYRAGVRSDLISVTDARHVTSSHGIRVVADLMLEDVDLSTYTVLFLPGGMPGTLGLKATPAIQTEVLRRSDESLPIAAICAAPSILSELGVLDGEPRVRQGHRRGRRDRSREPRGRRRVHHDQPRRRNRPRTRHRTRAPAPG